MHDLARAGVLSAEEWMVILAGKEASLVMGKVTWSFLKAQTFRKCKIVWKVLFLFEVCSFCLSSLSFLGYN